MNELKYCKFCDKEKPVKDFVKSGFAVKNICRECQNQKQTQIYKNSKKVEELQQENQQLKDNWNKLKEYLINDLNDRNGHRVAEYEDGNKVSETISPIYTLMEDKSKTMKEVLDKMQELEQGSDSNE